MLLQEYVLNVHVTRVGYFEESAFEPATPVKASEQPGPPTPQSPPALHSSSCNDTLQRLEAAVTDAWSQSLDAERLQRSQVRSPATRVAVLVQICC